MMSRVLLVCCMRSQKCIIYSIIKKSKKVSIECASKITNSTPLKSRESESILNNMKIMIRTKEGLFH